MKSIWQDIQLGFRMLIKKPMVTAIGCRDAGSGDRRDDSGVQLILTSTCIPSRTSTKTRTFWYALI